MTVDKSTLPLYKATCFVFKDETHLKLSFLRCFWIRHFSGLLNNALSNHNMTPDNVFLFIFMMTGKENIYFSCNCCKAKVQLVVLKWWRVTSKSSGGGPVIQTVTWLGTPSLTPVSVGKEKRCQRRGCVCVCVRHQMSHACVCPQCLCGRMETRRVEWTSTVGLASQYTPFYSIKS